MDQSSIDIVTIALNNIKLDEQTIIDRANGSTELDEVRNSGETQSKNAGLNVPYITINGYSITNFLTSFNMDMSGFIPTAVFSFVAAESVFISVNYPKDGDIASIYLRSPGDFYKPIRMDFLILSVESLVSSAHSSEGSDPQGKGINLRFTIVSECKIPGLYTQRIKSFRNMSSMDALLEISQDLNLGFSTNQSSLNDNMTWICPNYSYYDFIQEVSVRAYENDHTSFFDCWVDPYYNLNFVNLGSQFSFKDTPKYDAYIIPGYVNGSVKMDSAVAGSPSPDPTVIPLVITNYIGNGQIPFFINGYTLTSRSGNNTNEMGYINNIMFYDESLDKPNPSQKYVNYSIESITTEIVNTGTILQKGRARSDDYKEEKRSDWMGIFNPKTEKSEGVHENFLHAKFQNLININDSSKMTLEVELADFFPGIYRGQVLPVRIYVSEQGVRHHNVGKLPNNDSNTDNISTLDEFLSGNYVVKGMSISWSYGSPGMRHYLSLGKRQWDVNISGGLPKAYPILASAGNF